MIKNLSRNFSTVNQEWAGYIQCQFTASKIKEREREREVEPTFNLFLAIATVLSWCDIIKWFKTTKIEKEAQNCFA